MAQPLRKKHNKSINSLTDIFASSVACPVEPFEHPLVSSYALPAFSFELRELPLHTPVGCPVGVFEYPVSPFDSPVGFAAPPADAAVAVSVGLEDSAVQ